MRGCFAATDLRAASLPDLQTHGYETVVMVGDGITDYEAKALGGADAFIG